MSLRQLRLRVTHHAFPPKHNQGMHRAPTEQWTTQPVTRGSARWCQAHAGWRLTFAGWRLTLLSRVREPNRSLDVRNRRPWMMAHGRKNVFSCGWGDLRRGGAVPSGADFY